MFISVLGVALTLLQKSKFMMCKTRENSNFLKNGKIVISVKTRSFSRSQMIRWISLLESSCKILLTRRISSNSEAVKICTFFEASSIECRKMKYDLKKATNNMYSYDTCCMSREIMETDGRDCATCQNPSKGDMDGILEFVNKEKTK